MSNKKSLEEPYTSITHSLLFSYIGTNDLDTLSISPESIITYLHEDSVTIYNIPGKIFQ